jgi:hypothetical protein
LEIAAAKTALRFVDAVTITEVAKSKVFLIG